MFVAMIPSDRPVAPPVGSPRAGSASTLVLAWLASCTLLAPPTVDRARADDPPAVKLTLHPARIDEYAPLARLLPADPDLKPGNAAVVLLRMPWEQMGFMTGDYTKLEEAAKVHPADPRVTNLRFDHFAGEMRRGAFMRDADWNYPIDKEPYYEILLPDLQGLRTFVGHGMTVWVSQRLAKGDLNGAREGVLVQLACSRHLARTPFTINRLVAASLAVQGLDNLERVITNPASPNLHRELSLLPSTIAEGVAHLQWEAVANERSLPTLRAGIPEPGDTEAWGRVLDEWIELYAREDGTPASDKRSRLRVACAAAGREAFTESCPAGLDLATAGDDEVAARFLLAWTKIAAERAEAAWLRHPPEAIAALVDLSKLRKHSAERLTECVVGGTSEPLECYLSEHRFGRRARLLEVIETLRDAASRNGGRFPATLADVPAHVPLDPFTGQPFVYEPAADGRSARLATPPIPGVDDQRAARLYELSIAEPQ